MLVGNTLQVGNIDTVKMTGRRGRFRVEDSSRPPLPHTMASFSPCGFTTVSLCSPALPAHHALRVKTSPLAPIPAAPAKCSSTSPSTYRSISTHLYRLHHELHVKRVVPHHKLLVSLCSAAYLRRSLPGKEAMYKGVAASSLGEKQGRLRHCKALVLGREETVLQCGLQIRPCHHLCLPRQHLLIPSLLKNTCSL